MIADYLHERISVAHAAYQATVYLVGPSRGTEAERAARFGPVVAALMALGYLVVAPGWTHPDAATADELLSLVDEDLDALASADLVVTLPGSDALFEPAIAEALGILVVTFDDLAREQVPA